MVGLIESEKVLLAFTVVHVTMQFVDVPSGNHLGWAVISFNLSLGSLGVSVSKVSISEAIPVQI
jgi:hypothetical protein